MDDIKWIACKEELPPHSGYYGFSWKATSGESLSTTLYYISADGCVDMPAQFPGVAQEQGFQAQNYFVNLLRNSMKDTDGTGAYYWCHLLD